MMAEIVTLGKVRQSGKQAIKGKAKRLKRAKGRRRQPPPCL